MLYISKIQYAVADYVRLLFPAKVNCISRDAIVKDAEDVLDWDSAGTW